MFTINRLGLPSVLLRCLGTTDIIDNGHAAARDRMRRVKNWQSGSMALRWTAAALSRRWTRSRSWAWWAIPRWRRSPAWSRRDSGPRSTA